jgi:hypothetical protein
MKLDFAAGKQDADRKFLVLEICKCFKAAVSEKLMYRSISTQIGFLESYALLAV